ncbi:flagellar motor switch protein FliM [Mariprofundus micogutta]|uniref:Flagellar motor switch protein FliM n=1 Tax=Mariprofundus micogutta TaxID=1921010 RepID=A0A1L8CKI5_9PROT|nr:FliM/FliN family flagellar motor switch protein [Mariprofundus micogutta]GAV19411.1 flagellar motor switch protein FliM [Mariprofundus micogutta]
MSEPILAPEEIEALMAEVAPSEETEALFAALPPIKQPENVDEYHFSSADDDGPERYPMFVNLQERLVEILDEQWDELFRRDINVHVDRLENTVYKDLITVESPQVYFVFEVEDNGKMMITCDTAMIVAFVDAMLGGEGESSDTPQSLSPVEMRLSHRIAVKLANSLSTVWAPVHELDFQVIKLDDDPQFLAVTSAYETCFSAYFEVKISDNLTSKFGIHYPQPFLEPMLETLRVTVSDEPTETDTEWADALMDSISHTPTNIRFQLDSCQVDIGTFLNLKPGDFLPMKIRQNELCTIWIEDICMFEAKPGDQNGMLAAEIVAPTKPGG